VTTSIALRPVTAADQHLLLEVYAGSRAPEMKLVPWTEDQKNAFLQSQFEAQQAHYEKTFSDADYSIVVVDGESVGRLWIDENDTQIRILDLAILPSKRGKGVGTSLLEDLIDRARESGRSIQVYVETYQRSVNLLARLGFRVVEDAGINRLMEWSPDSDPPEISTRPVTDEDAEFLIELYRDLRAPELELLGWDEDQISDFANMQYDAQRAGYRARFPNAEYQVVARGETLIGRLIVDRKDSHITLVDITIRSALRRQGVGTHLIEELLAEARAGGKQVLLSVAKGNPARRLYERLGFQSIETDGIYERMSWRPDR
jgi:ribosomal protein S18 acetylase RimI-like enzyme